MSAEESDRPCDHEPEAFERFWDEYPNKFFKYEAKKIWDELKLPESEISRIMAYVKECKDSGIWNYFNRPLSASWFLDDRIWQRNDEGYALDEDRVIFRGALFRESDYDGVLWLPGNSCSAGAEKKTTET